MSTVFASGPEVVCQLSIAILCQEVRELGTLYIYIYAFCVVVSQHIFSQLRGIKYSYLIQIIRTQPYYFKYFYQIRIIYSQLYGFE